MSIRKRLIISIDCLNKKLWYEQSKLNDHKRYFYRLFHDNTLSISGALLAAFIAGWQSGHVPRHIQKIKKFSKFAALTLISHIKKG